MSRVCFILQDPISGQIYHTAELFGFLVPYFDRAVARFATPPCKICTYCQSSDPEREEARLAVLIRNRLRDKP